MKEETQHTQEGKSGKVVITVQYYDKKGNLVTETKEEDAIPDYVDEIDLCTREGFLRTNNRFETGTSSAIDRARRKAAEEYYGKSALKKKK